MQLPSILSFDKTNARAKWRAENGVNAFRSLTVRGKPKLHGVSMAISARADTGGNLTVRSKLRKDSDSMELAAPGFSEIRDEVEQTLWAGKRLAWGETGIFAEWAGPGIQKKDAICKIDRPRLFVFGAWFVNGGRDLDLIDEGQDMSDGTARRAIYSRVSLVTDPESLGRILNPSEHVMILPWITGDLTTEGRDAARVSEVIEDANRIVGKFSVEDPYVKNMFGISAPGEGFVAAPVSHAFNEATLLDFAELSWKAKTDAHAVKKMAAPVVEKTEMPGNVVEFAATFVTDARVEQILSETFPDGSVDKAGTGKFLAAMIADVFKESREERKVLGAPDVLLEKAVRNAARSAFFLKLEAAAPRP